MYLRLVAAVVALAAGAAGVIVVVLLLRTVPGPTSSATSAAPVARPAPVIEGGRVATPNDPVFPSPPPGAVVFAREAGDRALGLAVKPGFVRVSVLGPHGPGEAGLKVSLRFGRGYYVPADPCGPGCYQARVGGTPVSPVSVILRGKAYAFALPKLPAADASEIVSRAAATWNELRTLVWHERIASNTTNALHIVYRAVAPDELEYVIQGRSAAVIIGGNRWDRPSPTAPWIHGEQNPSLRQPQPFWDAAADAYLLGADQVAGRPVWHVSFFDPTSPAWFEAWIDQKSYRTLQLDMTAAGHFMHDTYGPFDSPFRLTPPT